MMWVYLEPDADRSSFFTKQIAKYLLYNIEAWVIEKNLLLKEQTGFRFGHSTIHNCSVLCHLIEKYIAKGNELFAMFIDLSAAFNSINGRTYFGRNLRI